MSSDDEEWAAMPVKKNKRKNKRAIVEESDRQMLNIESNSSSKRSNAENVSTKEDFELKINNDGNIQCTRCKTYVETDEIVIGSTLTTQGTAGVTRWRHLDCIEVAVVAKLLVGCESAEEAGERIEGFEALEDDDKDVVNTTLWDISQGLNQKRVAERMKEGRKVPLKKKAPQLTTTEFGYKGQENKAEETEGGTVKPQTTPWFLVAKEKRQAELAVIREAKEKKAKRQMEKEAKQKEAEEKQKEREERKARIQARKEAKAAEKERKAEEKRRKAEERAERIANGEEVEPEEPPSEPEKEENQEGEDGNLDEEGSEEDGKSSKKRGRGKESGGKAEKKRKVLADENAPKKVKTGYMWFSETQRSLIKTTNPSLNPKEIMKELAAAWKELTPAQRKPFDTLHANDKKRFARQMKEYKETGTFALEIRTFDELEDGDVSAHLTQSILQKAEERAEQEQAEQEQVEQEKAQKENGANDTMHQDDGECSDIPNQEEETMPSASQSKPKSHTQTTFLTNETTTPDEDPRRSKKKRSFKKFALQPVSRLTF